jgi:5-methylcytosine-specific restriction endonuclease McrA
MKTIKNHVNGILNRQVLVLNQNYHPLLVCTARRAISLAYLGKVEIIEKYRETVHSPSVAMPLPSVVKLDRFIHVRESSIVLSRRNILKRDRHQCQYCERRSVPMTLDHIIPKERMVRTAGKTWFAVATLATGQKGIVLRSRRE